jgi:hypothetical protein
MPHLPNHDHSHTHIKTMRIKDHIPQLSKQLPAQAQPDNTDDTNIKQQQQQHTNITNNIRHT